MDGDFNDDSNKNTIGESIGIIKDFQNKLYTIDVIDAIGLTLFEEPAIRSIIVTFSYDDRKETGAKLTIAGTIDKVTHILEHLYTADLIDATGIAFLNEGAVGNLLDIFSYEDPKGDKTDDENKLTVQETIDKVLDITSLYTIDLIDALDLDALKEGGDYAFIVDALAYKDGEKLTVGGTVEHLMADFMDIFYTADFCT